MSSTTTTPWLQTFAPNPAARLRLICFHPAGAGANFFRPWTSRLPAEIEVSAVCLPGRESRYREARLTDHRDVVAAAHAAIRPLLSRPYALFGHSMGALLAYGVALTAARLGDPAPERLLLSGTGGPGSDPVKAGRGAWTDEDLVADLRAMGGTPEEVLADPDLLALILPALRADYAICDSFRAATPTTPATPPLTCPLTLMGGQDDHHKAPDLARWAPVTTGPVTQYAFPGGHFYLARESADEALATVTAELASLPARRAFGP